MEYDFLHPKYGKADVDRPFGRIIFQSIEPQVSFSCEFAYGFSDLVKEMIGPVLVMDVQLLEAHAIIDKFIFMEADDTGDPVVGISIDEVNDNLVIGKEYIMYLFVDYNYQTELKVRGIDRMTGTRDITIPTNYDFFTVLENPIGTVKLIVNPDFVENESNIKAFPRVEVSQRIHLINSVVIALNPDADTMMFIDFCSKAHMDAMKQYKGALGQHMSDQIALVVFAMIMAHLEGEAETNVEYNIYQAVCTN
ncbi:hypothetical protein HGB13_04590 [bacterium]|nr:hypothetical protein [bacterium]